MLQFLYISFLAVELQGEKSRAGSHRDQLQVRPKRTRSSRYLKFRKIKQMKSKSCPPFFVLKGAVFFPPDGGEVKRPTHKAHHLIENQLPSPLSGYVLTDCFADVAQSIAHLEGKYPIRWGEQLRQLQAGDGLFAASHCANRVRKPHRDPSPTDDYEPDRTSSGDLWESHQL